jgi:hypothetical protein
MTIAEPPPTADVTQVLAAADERLRDWNLRCKTFYIYHYLGGILGIVLNLIIATFAKLNAEELDWLFWTALIAAILQGLTTFLSAKRKAAAYRAGWRTLWIAKKRLETGVEPDPAKVLAAVEKGWALINEGDKESS